MFKKSLSVVLVVLIALGVFLPATFYAVKYYTYSEDDNLNITAQESNSEDGVFITKVVAHNPNRYMYFTLPSEINGRKVVGVFNDIFKCSNINNSVGAHMRTFEYGEGFTRTFNTFNYCDALNAIVLHDKITEIGKNSFKDLISLTDINMPDSLTTIEESAFEGCRHVKLDHVGRNVTTIGAHAFKGCKNIKTIIIPEGVKRIEEGTFEDCENLDTVFLPESLEYIGPNAFANTPIGEIYIPSKTAVSDTAFGTHDPNILNERYAYYDNPDGTVTLEGFYENVIFNVPTELGGKKVTEIREKAFYNHYLFSTADGKYKPEIGSNIRKIGDKAFAYTGARTNDFTLNFELRGDAELGEDILLDSDMKTSLKIVGDADIGESFANFNYFTEVNVGSGVRKIGSKAFRKCSKLEKVTIQEGVRSVGDYAFYDCVSLKEIKLPSTLTEIGDYAFGYNEYNDKPKVVYWFNVDCPVGSAAEKYAADVGVFLINNIFKYEVTDGMLAITGLRDGIECPQELFIPATLAGQRVWHIGKSAFEYKKMKSVVFEDGGPTEIEEYAFGDCKKLTYVKLPDTHLSVKDHAFDGCRTLETVIMPKVDYIYQSAFTNCDSLAEIYIPNSLRSVLGDGWSFTHTTTLIVEKDSYAEEYAKKNEYTYRYPENSSGTGWKYEEATGTFTVTGEGKFEPDDAAATALYKANYFVAADGVTAIGDAVCFMSDKLLGVRLGGSVTEVGDMSFASCKNLRSISLGKKLEKLGDGVFTGSDSLNLITISEGNEHYKIVNDILVTKDGKRTVLCPAGRSDEVVIVPDGVEKIGSCCFTNCVAAKKIILPDTVKTLAENAFSNCKKLEALNIPDGITAIPAETFYGCEAMKSVKIPESVTEIGTRAMGWYWDTEKLAYAKVEGFRVIGTKGTAAEKYAKNNGFEFEEYVEPTEPPTTAPETTAPITTEPVTTEPAETTEPTESSEPTSETTNPVETTEPQTATDPQATTAQVTTAPAVIAKKANPVKVTVKTKTVKLKNLKKKAQTVKAITVKNAKGKVTYKLTSVPKKIKKLTKISSKGVITIKKWKKAKKATYKIKITATAKGTANYNKKSVTKTVTIKIK